ncbi:hypothetical protein J5N97_002487 [Dioscorea zingiberensis]|uniref:Uncharacterized protein n=1 Tax=Dioscorea zingiberensis TaxID=325984 RepID=A0A9D5D2T7_9LILI|nr:hypothetical protein J5N97_002487 [Dioscorea zingiberensis]
MEFLAQFNSRLSFLPSSLLLRRLARSPANTAVSCRTTSDWHISTGSVDGVPDSRKDRKRVESMRTGATWQHNDGERGGGRWEGTGERVRVKVFNYVIINLVR